MKRKNTSMLSALAVAIALTTQAIPAQAQGPIKTNQFWWPEQLNLSPLRSQGAASNPLGEDFNYAEAFAKLDLEAVKKISKA